MSKRQLENAVMGETQNPKKRKKIKEENEHEKRVKTESLFDNKPKLLQMVQSNEDKKDLWRIYEQLPLSQIQENLSNVIKTQSPDTINRIYYKTVSFHDIFPKELQIGILSFLSVFDLISGSRISIEWRRNTEIVMDRKFIRNLVLSHPYLSQLFIFLPVRYKKGFRFYVLCKHKYDWNKKELQKDDALLFWLSQKLGYGASVDPVAYDDGCYFDDSGFGHRTVTRWTEIGDEGSFIPIQYDVSPYRDQAIMNDRSEAYVQYTLRSEHFQDPTDYNIVDCYAAICIVVPSVSVRQAFVS